VGAGRPRKGGGSDGCSTRRERNPKPRLIPCLGNDFLCILPTLEGWVYRVSYTWASMGYTGHMGHSHIYTLT
jgi:hypothetical protein